MSRRQAASPGPARSTAPEEGLSREQQKIARWLKKLKFHKGIFGGVRETEVWKRMNELNSLYKEASGSRAGSLRRADSGSKGIRRRWEDRRSRLPEGG